MSTFLRIASELKDVTNDVAVCLGIFCIANLVVLWLASSKSAVESHGTRSPLAKRKDNRYAPSSACKVLISARATNGSPMSEAPIHALEHSTVAMTFLYRRQPRTDGGRKGDASTNGRERPIDLIGRSQTRPERTDVTTVPFRNKQQEDKERDLPLVLSLNNERGWSGSHCPPQKYGPSLRRTS